MFRGLLFDLDDTLAATRGVQKACQDNDQTAFARALPLVRAAPGMVDTLGALSQLVPMGVVTASRRWYADRLLATLFPGIEWAAVVCGREAERPKPYPDGLQQAAELLGIDSPRDLAYVGDGAGDIEAAYHGGIVPVLATWVDQRQRALELCPDAILRQPRELLEFVQRPAQFLPALESGLAEPPAPHARARTLDISVRDVRYPVQVLGRYFAREGNTLGLHQTHVLSQQIARKATPPFPIPDAWIPILLQVVEAAVVNESINTVTTVPAKPGRDPRLERLLARLESELPSRLQRRVVFDATLLQFSDEAEQVKHASTAARLEAVEATLFVTRSVRGRRIALIDDVVTTGATLGTAARLLREAGASVVRLIALAKAIGGVQFTVSLEERTCPSCGTRLVQRQRRDGIGAPFWGCKSFPRCRHTESV